jgi:hypothetical protein
MSGKKPSEYREVLMFRREILDTKSGRASLNKTFKKLIDWYRLGVYETESMVCIDVWPIDDKNLNPVDKMHAYVKDAKESLPEDISRYFFGVGVIHLDRMKRLDLD